MQDISGKVMQDLVFGNDGRLGLRWNLNPKPTIISNWFFFGSFIFYLIDIFCLKYCSFFLTHSGCLQNHLELMFLKNAYSASPLRNFGGILRNGVWSMDHRSGKVTEYQTYQSSHVKGAIALCCCQSCCSLSWLLSGAELNLTEILFRSLALVR